MVVEVVQPLSLIIMNQMITVDQSDQTEVVDDDESHQKTVTLPPTMVTLRPGDEVQNDEIKVSVKGELVSQKKQKEVTFLLEQPCLIAPEL